MEFYFLMISIAKSEDDSLVANINFYIHVFWGITQRNFSKRGTIVWSLICKTKIASISLFPFNGTKTGNMMLLVGGHLWGEVGLFLVFLVLTWAGRSRLNEGIRQYREQLTNDK